MIFLLVECRILLYIEVKLAMKLTSAIS